MSKEEMLYNVQTEFANVMKKVESYPIEVQREDFKQDDRDKNIKDILTHLHEWHLMLLTWYREGKKGNVPVLPREGYSWVKLSDLNQMIWDLYQTTSLDEAKQLLHQSYKEVVDILQKASEEELFTPNYYVWQDGQPLAVYIHANTAEHYKWAINKMERLMSKK